MFKDIIISAPFGNYLNYPEATSTIGTFTLHNRGGITKRIWRCARTLRPLWRAQGWINKLGLPNPGIHSLCLTNSYINKIISIHGFNKDEWEKLAYTVIHHHALAIELNLSCPNVGHKHAIADFECATSYLLATAQYVVAKLPPVRWMALAEPLYAMGIRAFHCCNTIPSPGGGISGKPVKQFSMWAVEELKQKWGNNIRVIGGGGVTTEQDIIDYKKVGADHVAIGSAFLNPFRWRSLRKICSTKTASVEQSTQLVEYPDRCIPCEPNIAPPTAIKKDCADGN